MTAPSGSVPEPAKRRRPVLRQPRPRGRANDATRELLPEPAERRRYNPGARCTTCGHLGAHSVHGVNNPDGHAQTPPVPAPTEPKENTVILYPPEILSEDDDDGTMPTNLAELAEAVVGHRIVSAEQRTDLPEPDGSYRWRNDGLLLTLDNGRQVSLVNTDDCCASTELEAFLLHPDRVDHIIMGVGTTEGFTRWHIYADAGDVLEMTVGWSCGNPFYYAYGFGIDVIDRPRG